MYLIGIVAVTLEMASHEGLDLFSFQIGPREGPRVEQNLPQVLSERISIPHSKMERLVSSEEQARQPQARKEMVDPREPLRHSHVICVLGLEEEFEKKPG